MPAGRPSKYTEDVATEICQWISEGKTLLSYCRREGTPDYATIMRWLLAHDEFCEKYTQARETQAHVWFEQSLEIADDGRNDTYVDDEGKEKVDYDHIQRSKLRVDTRKWAAGRLCGKYSDKQTHKFEGADGEAIAPVINITVGKTTT